MNQEQWQNATRWERRNELIRRQMNPRQAATLSMYSWEKLPIHAQMILEAKEKL